MLLYMPLQYYCVACLGEEKYNKVFPGIELICLEKLK